MAQAGGGPGGDAAAGTGTGDGSYHRAQRAVEAAVALAEEMGLQHRDAQRALAMYAVALLRRGRFSDVLALGSVLRREGVTVVRRLARPILLAAGAARRPGDVVPLLRESFGVPRRAMGVQELTRIVELAAGTRSWLGLRPLLPVCLGRYVERLPASTLADLGLVAAHYRCDEWMDRAVGELVRRRRARQRRQASEASKGNTQRGGGSGVTSEGSSPIPRVDSSDKAREAVLTELAQRCGAAWGRARVTGSRRGEGGRAREQQKWADRAREQLPDEVLEAVGADSASAARHDGGVTSEGGQAREDVHGDWAGALWGLVHCMEVQTGRVWTDGRQLALRVLAESDTAAAPLEAEAVPMVGGSDGGSEGQAHQWGASGAEEQGHEGI